MTELIPQPPAASPRSATPHAYCRRCGYALVGLGGDTRACPECGRAFDPADPRTTARRPPRSWIWRWARRVAALLLLAAVAAGGGYAWLYRGWAAERPARDAAATVRGPTGLVVPLPGFPFPTVRVTYRTIGPGWVGRALGIVGRAHVLERVEALDLRGLSVAQVATVRIGDLPYLRSLTLLDSPVDAATLARIGRRRALRDLKLFRIGLRGADLAPLASLSSLGSLTLSGDEIDDAATAHVRDLGRLRLLVLGGGRVTDAGLADVGRVAGLEKLSLSCPLVTDAGLARLRGLTALRRLDLFGTRVTPAGVAALKAAIPGLRVYDEAGEFSR